MDVVASDGSYTQRFATNDAASAPSRAAGYLAAVAVNSASDAHDSIAGSRSVTASSMELIAAARAMAASHAEIAMVAAGLCVVATGALVGATEPPGEQAATSMVIASKVVDKRRLLSTALRRTAVTESAHRALLDRIPGPASA